jgi:hypothetical protein
MHRRDRGMRSPRDGRVIAAWSSSVIPSTMTECASPRPLFRLQLREAEIAVARAARQGLGSFQANAARRVGIEVKSTDTRQDFVIAMARGELAEATRLVVDAELKIVAGPGLDEIVDESSVYSCARLRAACSRSKA